MKAHEILQAGIDHMKDRAATYDKPEGERSMGATVAAFNAITGHELSETDGWIFMCLLKIVRSRQGAYRADNFEDLTAYAGLAGEAAHRSRTPDLPNKAGEMVSQKYPFTSDAIEQWRANNGDTKNDNQI